MNVSPIIWYFTVGEASERRRFALLPLRAGGAVEFEDVHSVEH